MTNPTVSPPRPSVEAASIGAKTGPHPAYAAFRRILVIVAGLLLLGLVKNGLQHWLAKDSDPLREMKDFHAAMYVITLDRAVREYEKDFGRLPEGDGTGSSALARSLSVRSGQGSPYLSLEAGQIDADGNILYPLKPHPVIRYRNNRDHPGAANRNPDFDLWWSDADGVRDGINNFGITIR